MLSWENRLKMIEESPYYEIPLSEFKVGLECEYCYNWASIEWCFAAEPKIYHIFELSRGFNIDSDAQKFRPHIVTEEDVKMMEAINEVCGYNNMASVSYFRGVKKYRDVQIKEDENI